MPDPNHPTIDLAPIDLARFRGGNRGIPYVWTFRSGATGPHVLVNALTHGNEVCGAHALARLLDDGLRPDRGTLTFGFANVAAYESFDPEYPFVSRFLDEDFNRVWDAATLDGPRASRELERARALRPVIDEADHLLDLHSTELPQAAMLLAGTRGKNLALARAIGFPSHVVLDAGHKSGRRLRDYGKFDAPDHPGLSLLVESGSHFERPSATVALATTLLFLRHFGIVDDRAIERYGVTRPTSPQRVVKVTDAVTIKSDRFAFARGFRGFDVVAEAGTVIAEDDGEPVRTPYPDCVLVMPARNPTKGLTAVRLGRSVP
ncbi:MAG: succinylglutamate desuccinylase/aspartoacylase family protein [Alphaproteobacteria bacterium]